MLANSEGRCRIACVAMLAFLTLALNGLSANYVWTGAASSDWMNRTNWTPSTGVPLTAADTATVAYGTADLGTNAITLGGLLFIDGTIQSGSSGGFTIVNSLVWTGGWLRANAILSPGSATALDGSSDEYFLERSLVNAGTFTWRAGILRVGLSATFSNLPTPCWI